MADDIGLLREKQVAAQLGLTVRALQRWRGAGLGPTFVRISGRCVRYHPADVAAWIATLKRTGNRDTGPEAARSTR